MSKDRLKVIETTNEYYVSYTDSELDDWVAKFDKSWIEARFWACHMAHVYNSKLGDSN